MSWDIGGNRLGDLPLSELDDVLDSIHDLDSSAIVNQANTGIVSMRQSETSRATHSPV